MSKLKIYTIFFLLTLMACQDDPSFILDEDKLYTPALTSTKADGQVTLSWVKPICSLCMSCECPQLDPDSFEILFSENNPSKLKYHSTIDKNSFEETIKNLSNNKPYYFAIKAIAKKQTTVSNIVMVIPSPNKTVQVEFLLEDKDVNFGSLSPDLRSIGYVSNYLWNDGNNGSESVFIYSFSKGKETLIEKSSRMPEWSPDGQKIVYQTDNNEVNIGGGFPTHIAVYDTKTQTITRLTDGNSFNFLPTWSPDGKQIAFLSDKAGGSEFNIWKMSADGSQQVQLTKDFMDNNDFAIIDDRSPNSIGWSADGKSITFSRKAQSNTGMHTVIYAIPADGGNKSTLISSQWDDFAPAFAPDGQSIVFVSNRSGKNEIWKMNLQTKKLSQITSDKDHWVFANPEKIEWSGSKILFTSNLDQYRALYTVDMK